jgi:hypothetical protein
MQRAHDRRPLVAGGTGAGAVQPTFFEIYDRLRGRLVHLILTKPSKKNAQNQTGWQRIRGDRAIMRTGGSGSLR